MAPVPPPKDSDQQKPVVSPPPPPEQRDREIHEAFAAIGRVGTRILLGDKEYAKGLEKRVAELEREVAELRDIAAEIEARKV